jgi:hypothetical protein
MVIAALGKPATVSFRLVSFSTAWHSLMIQNNEYTEVSGLNNNIVMTTALCINTPAPLCEHLHLLGMTTLDNSKHLGILLGKTIKSTVETIMAHSEPKSIKTIPPTDVLNRFTLTNIAPLPVYNHMFMALLVELGTLRS